MIIRIGKPINDCMKNYGILKNVYSIEVRFHTTIVDMSFSTFLYAGNSYDLDDIVTYLDKCLSITSKFLLGEVSTINYKEIDYMFYEKYIEEFNNSSFYNDVDFVIEYELTFYDKEGIQREAEVLMQ